MVIFLGLVHIRSVCVHCFATVEYVLEGNSFFSSWRPFWNSSNRITIMHLQVQSDHFDEFFAPELEKHGYAAVYKKKTGEVQ